MIKLHKKERWPSLCHLHIRAWRLSVDFSPNFECHYQYLLVYGKLLFKTTHQLSGPYPMLALREKFSCSERGDANKSCPPTCYKVQYWIYATDGFSKTLESKVIKTDLCQMVERVDIKYIGFVMIGPSSWGGEVGVYFI